MAIQRATIDSRVDKELAMAKNVLLFGLFRRGFHYARINSLRLDTNANQMLRERLVRRGVLQASAVTPFLIFP